MSFSVSAEAYDRFMGRWSGPLAQRFVELAGVVEGHRVVDVGCGPGALTAELVDRLGPDAVAAVDPSEPFVVAATERFPGVDVRRAGAEALPFPDDSFDAALAQLVVHFMSDPVAGLAEMARVTRPGGTVAACVWDFAGGGSPLAVFYQALREVDPDADDESGMAGTKPGQLTELCDQAGLRDIEPGLLTVRVPAPDFDEWWQPFTLGVGPAGQAVARLDETRRERLRARCEQLLPPAPFDVVASAWAVRARV